MKLLLAVALLAIALASAPQNIWVQRRTILLAEYEVVRIVVIRVLFFDI